MGSITKLNLYLSELQYQKLCLLAKSLNKEPEEVANDAVYGYLATADPFADDDDREPPQDTTEILFYISDAEAAEIEKRLNLHSPDDLDAYAKYLLLKDLYSSPKREDERDTDK